MAVIKETVQRFYIGVHGTVSSSGIRSTLHGLDFDRFDCKWIGPKWSTYNRREAIGPIRNTIKPLRSQGLKKLKTLKVNLILELETVPWTQHIKSLNFPFKKALVEKRPLLEIHIFT